MITNLNRIPDWLLAQARSMTDPGEVQSLLMAHTSPECWDYLTLFIDDVVFGNEAAANWMVGQVVVPDFSLSEQLTLTRSSLLEPIGGAFMHRIIPSLDDWRSNASWLGAPAQVLPNADYRFQLPEQGIGMGNAATEEIANSTVAIRRWIATRIAQVVKAGLPPQSMDQLTGVLKDFPAMTQWTDDALRAASALVREYQEFGEDANAIPGMRAPDDWYN